MFAKSIVLLVGLCSTLYAKELPDFIKPIRCSRSSADSEQCLIDAINKIRPQLVEGVPEMGVPSIDPLVIPHLKLDTGNSTSFSFVADIDNLTLEGAKELLCTKAKLDLDNISFEFSLKIPNLWISGIYKAVGKVLVIQFNGGGAMSMNVTDATINGKMSGKAVTKKGKEHYHFDKYELVIDVAGSFATNFENLLPDPAVNERTNQLINENADVFYDELKPIIGSAIGEIFVNVFNEVHDRYPNDVLYTDS